MESCIKKAKLGPMFWTIIGVVIAALSLAATVVAVVVGVMTYNERYNTNFTDACNGYEIKCEFKANGKSTATKTVTLTSGNVYCGYYQENGKNFGKYDVSYKKSNECNYKMIKSINCQANNIYYGGDIWISSSKTSTKYDFKVVKTNNDSPSSTFILDVIVG